MTGGRRGRARRPAGHVVLVGLSGGGKTALGRALAAALARPFVDTDDLVAQRAGVPIPALFAGRGEAAFRALERAAVADAVAGPAAVIATGGGAPLDPESRRRLWDGNLVAWLDAPADELARRVRAAGGGRPLLEDGAGQGGEGDGTSEEGAAARLAALLASQRAARAPVYAAAHIRIDTHRLGEAGSVAPLRRAIEERLGGAPTT